MKKLFHSFFLCILFLVAFRCGALYADRQHEEAELPAVHAAVFGYSEQNNQNPTLEEDLHQAVNWPAAEEYFREKLPLIRESIQNCLAVSRYFIEKGCTDISESMMWLLEHMKEETEEIQNEFIKTGPVF